MYRFTIYIYICVYVGYNDVLPKHLGVSLKTVWPGKIIFQHIFHPTRPLFHSHHCFWRSKSWWWRSFARPSHQPLTLTNELRPYHGSEVLGKKRVASKVYLYIYINYLQKWVVSNTIAKPNDNGFSGNPNRKVVHFCYLNQKSEDGILSFRYAHRIGHQIPTLSKKRHMRTWVLPTIYGLGAFQIAPDSGDSTPESQLFSLRLLLQSAASRSLPLYPEFNRMAQASQV